MRSGAEFVFLFCFRIQGRDCPKSPQITQINTDFQFAKMQYADYQQIVIRENLCNLWTKDFLDSPFHLRYY